jgi:hypothetical protein
MSFNRIIRLTITVTSISVIAVGAVNLWPTSVAEKERAPVVTRNSLTGLPGTDGPILVVKIDDTPPAHPQVGLSEADVVYIEQVEGGLTRLAALYSSRIPELVGPVRSARISDIELLSQYGKVGFAFSGAQRKFLPVIAAANLYDVGAMRYGPQYYANDPARIAPYAMMLKSKDLLSKAQENGATFAVSASAGWNFGKPANNLKKITSARVTWPANSYEITWSNAESRWLLSHNGQPNLDSTGYHLGPKTFVVQIVSITDSIYSDKGGGITPLSETVGAGECYILRDGGYVRGKWSRPTEEDGTTFTNFKGEELTFDRGQIWFALSANIPTFAGVAAEDAPVKANK